MFATFRYVKTVVVQTIRNDLISYLDLEFIERLSIIFNGDIQSDIFQPWNGVEVSFKVLKLLAGNRNLAIDTFRCYINTPKDTVFAKPLIELVAAFFWIFNVVILIKRERHSLFVRSQHTIF